MASGGREIRPRIPVLDFQNFLFFGLPHPLKFLRTLLLVVYKSFFIVSFLIFSVVETAFISFYD